MSFSITHRPYAIDMQGVSKVYKLYGSQRDQLIDVLRLQHIGFKIKNPLKEFIALNNISLTVPKGHRIGIVGRNGAGKTTLLKLICGNFTPTQGSVEINGTVQALMSTGLGFHPEYTGRENVEATLQYNGLSKDEYREAIEDIIDFCELDDFLDQPFKTYSLGMQARLMFAASTAIKPDILIVDEVLGAGDAYFVAKSKRRVEKLISSGCSMLLVSHSMQQVLELCDEAIWLDQGRIRMQGESFLVVKSYEQYLHGPISTIQISTPTTPFIDPPPQPETQKAQQFSALINQSFRRSDLQTDALLQEPRFCPHETTQVLTKPLHRPTSLNFIAQGGISRWESDSGLKIIGFIIVTECGVTNHLLSMQPAKFVINTKAEFEGNFECRYGITIYDHLGSCVTKIMSPIDSFSLPKSGTHCVEMLLNPNQLGPGEYILSVSIHKNSAIEQLNSAGRFDLLSRSFTFSVEIPESITVLTAAFFHSAEWIFDSKPVEEIL